MAEETKKEEGKGCCPCGKSSCCCKAFGAIALLVVGGVAGYFAGRHCALKQCSMATPAPIAAPAPAAAPVAPKK